MTNASTRKSAAAAKRSPLTLAGVGDGSFATSFISLHFSFLLH